MSVAKGQQSGPASPFTAEQIRATREKVGSAGIALVSRAPHFGLAWAKMRPRAQVPGVVPGIMKTWAVTADGVVIADPDFTATLTIGQATFALAHEILHVLMDHFQRAVDMGIAAVDAAGKLDVPPSRREDWAILGEANDMAINHALKQDGIGDASIPGILFPPAEYLATGGPITSEAIFWWLKKNQKARPQPKEGQGQGQGQPKEGQGQPAPGQGCNPLPPQAGQGKGGEGDQPGKGGEGDQPGKNGQPGPGQIDWKQVRREVEAFAREGMGRGFGTAVADLLSPKPAATDYKKVIRQGAQHVNHEAEERSRRTFSRLSRRPFGDVSILRPGHIGTTGTIAIAADCSGSMSRTAVAKIAGEALKVCAQFPNVRVIFVTHTSEVTFAKILKPGGSVKDITAGLAFTGGTAAAPAYAKIRELAGEGVKVDTLIHYTDCYIESPWPDTSFARQVVIGECGEASANPAVGTPRPPKARRLPVNIGPEGE